MFSSTTISRLFAFSIAALLASSIARDADACAASLPDAFAIREHPSDTDGRVAFEGAGDAITLGGGSGRQIWLTLQRPSSLANASVSATLGGQALAAVSQPPEFAGASRVGFVVPDSPTRFDGSDLRILVGGKIVRRWTVTFRKGQSGPCPGPSPTPAAELDSGCAQVRARRGSAAPTLLLAALALAFVRWRRRSA